MEIEIINASNSGNQATFHLSANAISGLLQRISDLKENIHKGRLQSNTRGCFAEPCLC